MKDALTRHQIELLAPARNAAAGRIAIDSGADAIYIGGPSFGARASVGNSADEIASLVSYAQKFDVRVYAALNTLIYENELAAAERTARDLIASGVDALIIQDMAFLRMGLEGIEFHASTQMCNCTPERVKFLREAGFARVILERGLTMDEIRAIGPVEDIELECFVHGAICVGFSGQCYMSRSMNGRSGNRGDCSQPCRLTYDLIDGEGRAYTTGKHLLSVRDLNLSEHIPALLDAGITSFKIEGRLKDDNYVRNVVGYYRHIIDRALESRPVLQKSSSGHSVLGFEPDPSRSFSRGFTAWTPGGKRAGQSSFTTPKATGQFIGKVGKISRDSFELEPSTESGQRNYKSGASQDFARLHPADGICFISDGVLAGTNINRVEGRTVWPNKMDGIERGTDIMRNYDHRFNAMLDSSRTRRTVDITIHAKATANGLTVTFVDEEGYVAETLLTGKFEPAKDSSKMSDTIRTQLSKLGETIFSATTVDLKCEDGTTPFIPVYMLNELRRQAAAKLLDTRQSNHHARKLYIENTSFPYPETNLGAEANVTNSLAARFYRDHGVVSIDRANDLQPSLSGRRVMTSAYCLRRELGQCLKEKPTLKGPLKLRRGAIVWQLEFDCELCRMNIIKE